MTICTFIGDYNAPKSIQERLKEALPELVRIYGVDFFYVGNEGNFSMMAEDCLYRLCRIYANVGFKAIECDSTKKVFGKKSKEYKRDRCLVKKSQYVLAYAGDDSNAYRLIKYAERKGKTVFKSVQRYIKKLPCNGEFSLYYEIKSADDHFLFSEISPAVLCSAFTLPPYSATHPFS